MNPVHIGRLQVPPLPAGRREEWPIGLSDGCVRAVFDGHKTQLRQPLQHQPPDDAIGFTLDDDGILSWISGGEPRHVEANPPARRGGLLWVREPWAARPDLDPEANLALARQHLRYRVDGGFDPADPAHAEPYGGAWRHPREMPRWASRLTLEVLSVRLERIREISDMDIAEEGGLWRRPGERLSRDEERAGFARWWDEISTRPGRGWEANPWVWAVRFRLSGG